MPLAGHDDGDPPIAKTRFKFQSACPLRGTTLTRIITSCISTAFQSACPLRGTTSIADCISAEIDISIRVPLAGHDHPSHMRRVPRWAISIRVPLAGHDAEDIEAAKKAFISIRVPLAGHDERVFLDSSNQSPISIRVPLAGHDRIDFFFRRVGKQFQSACPLRGTTVMGIFREGKNAISIRVPLAGHDD